MCIQSDMRTVQDPCRLCTIQWMVYIGGVAVAKRKLLAISQGRHGAELTKFLTFADFPKMLEIPIKAHIIETKRASIVELL